jgi:hypothetical protein
MVDGFLGFALLVKKDMMFLSRKGLIVTLLVIQPPKFNYPIAVGLDKIISNQSSHEETRLAILLKTF